MTPEDVPLITGRVTDDAGRPVAEAAVAIVAAPGPVPDIAALTGADGRFTMSVAEPGEYTVVATAPDQRTGAVTVLVGAEGPVEGEVEIRVSFRG
ncbi:carboxypeptidase-like regulatory domain-containing protein [Agromyces sp. NPDC056523]|uniref:carboxypeptidase-like regulatory domain-containing protein n=1 Tax=Agromyces sp. NPDC056523 TaxID=3345850 RepID=UPI0036723E42